MMGGDKGTGKGTASATLVFPNGFEGCSIPVGVTDVFQNPALPLGFFVGGMGGNSGGECSQWESEEEWEEWEGWDWG